MTNPPSARQPGEQRCANVKCGHEQSLHHAGSYYCQFVSECGCGEFVAPPSPPAAREPETSFPPAQKPDETDARYIDRLQHWIRGDNAVIAGMRAEYEAEAATSAEYAALLRRVVAWSEWMVEAPNTPPALVNSMQKLDDLIADIRVALVKDDGGSDAL